MENKPTSNTRFMAELALLSAIIVIMSLTPLGYIKTPALSITLLTVPVAVGAIILGPKGGAILGGVFGATSFAQAIIGGTLTSLLLQVNPLGTLFLCMVPRILEGLLCGLLFRFLRKTGMKKLSYYIASFSCPVLNTVFFMGTIVALFYQTEPIQNLVGNLGVSNPLMFIIALVGVQGILETVICSFLAGILSTTLAKALKRS
ncbi:MAG: ECF transporter S component [Lachnospiraceae bacterium]